MKTDGTSTTSSLLLDGDEGQPFNQAAAEKIDEKLAKLVASVSRN
jgi:hypothetical protein